jgi:hypothetical protein
MSPAPDASGSAGPLTVVRLFRNVLVFLAAFCLAVFAGLDDLAIGSLLPGRWRIVFVRRRHAGVVTTYRAPNIHRQ